jgi:hypothetical protein
MAKTTITKILMRRGSDYDRLPTVLDEGEPGWTTDTCRLFVGDGRREGAFPVVNVRTTINASVHKFNNDLIYEPINDITGVTQPPTQEVLAINHPGLKLSMTREWMDDRYVMQDPCDSNSTKNPPDPIVCAPGSGLLPIQYINAHVDIAGDLTVHGTAKFLGISDFCASDMRVHILSGCGPSERVEVVGKAMRAPVGGTANRTSPAKEGDFRWNTDLRKMENFDGAVWTSVGGDTKNFYVNGSDVLEAVDNAAQAVADPSKYIFIDPVLQSIGLKAATVSEPVYLIKVQHDMNQIFNQVAVFDDYRRMVLPDEVYMADQNVCYINIASFLIFPNPGEWKLPDTGPGPILSTWTPPHGNPPTDKKWSIMIQA